jgi:hypothetical protein
VPTIVSESGSQPLNERAEQEIYCFLSNDGLWEHTGYRIAPILYTHGNVIDVKGSNHVIIYVDWVFSY